MPNCRAEDLAFVKWSRLVDETYLEGFQVETTHFVGFEFELRTVWQFFGLFLILSDRCEG